MPYLNYTPEVIKYICESKGVISMNQIAENLGVTRWALEKRCRLFRLDGMDIPKTRTQGMQPKRPKKPPKEKVIRVKPPKPPKVKKPKVKTAKVKATDKPLSVKDFTDCKYIRRDSRTWVAVRAI